MRKKFLALLLAFVMVVGMLPMTAFAADGFSDMDGHWSQDAVSRWSDVKVLNGDDKGNFNPDKEMSRAEFAQMLCNLMGYTEKAENTFTDVPDDAWYADAILKLNAAGVMSGVGGGLAAPNAPISREQAAVLLCRALNIKPSQSANINFSDGHTVSDWAKDAVAALTERGMINGVGNNNFAPALNINRASVATLVDNMVAEYVTENGATVTGEVNGVVIVKADNVKIEDATLTENIIVAPAAADATVSLTGTTTAADVVVAAEGAKVVVAETAAAGSVTVEAPKAEAQVAGKADAIVVAETAEGAKATVAETAEVKDVTVAAPKAETQVAGKVETVAVAETAEGAKATVAKTAEVTEVTVAAPKTETQVAGKVDTVAVAETAEGAKATVTKDAEVKDVTVAAPKTETSISGTVTNVAVADTATGANITANAGAKVENVTTAANDVTVNGAKDTISTVTTTGGTADVTSKGAEVKNEGADKVTVDGKTDVPKGDSTTSDKVGNTGSSTGGSTGGGSSSGGGSTNPPVETADVVAAPLADQAAENAIASDKLGTVTVSGTKTADKTYAVTITGTNIMKHTAANSAGDAHWVGFGVPSGEGYKFYDNTTEITTAENRKITVGEKEYNTIYFDDSDIAAGTKTIIVKKDSEVVATYNVTLNVTFWKATGVTVKAELTNAAGDEHPYNSQYSMRAIGAIATLNGYDFTLTGQIDLTKLNKNTEAGPKEYTYYYLTVKDEAIKTSECGGATFTPASDDCVVATRIWDNTSSSLLKATHEWSLKDAAGRVQDTVTVTVDATGCTVAGKTSVKVNFVLGGNTTTQTVLVGDDAVQVAVPTLTSSESVYYTGVWKKGNEKVTVADGKYSVSKPADGDPAEITLTAESVNIETATVSTRPAGHAQGTADTAHDGNFNYKATYEAAGMTFDGNALTTNAAKLAVYVAENTRDGAAKAAELGYISQDVNGTRYVMYGVTFNKPTEAASAAKAYFKITHGSEALDMPANWTTSSEGFNTVDLGTPDSANDFNSQYVDYINTASYATSTNKGDVTFGSDVSRHYLVVYTDASDNILAIQKATIERKVVEGTNSLTSLTAKAYDCEPTEENGAPAYVTHVMLKTGSIPTDKTNVGNVLKLSKDTLKFALTLTEEDGKFKSSVKNISGWTNWNADNSLWWNLHNTGLTLSIGAEAKEMTWIFQDNETTPKTYVAKVSVPASSDLSSLEGLILNPVDGWGEKDEPDGDAKYSGTTSTGDVSDT